MSNSKQGMGSTIDRDFIQEIAQDMVQDCIGTCDGVIEVFDSVSNVDFLMETFRRELEIEIASRKNRDEKSKPG